MERREKLPQHRLIRRVSPDPEESTLAVDEKVGADSLSVLTRFVLRARRVEQHSLAADKDRLLAWAKGTMELKVVGCIPQSVCLDLPDEEALDSLAARCRPFVLQSESIYHAKVMKALGYVVRNNAEHAQHAKELRERWKRLDKSAGIRLAYTSSTGKIGGSLGQPVSDLTLAYAWVYGDLVHADDITTVVDGHDINARYAGAVLLVSNLAVMTIMTLNFVRQLHADGTVRLDEQVFTTAVIARSGAVELPLTAFAVGPSETRREDLERALDQPLT